MTVSFRFTHNNYYPGGAAPQMGAPKGTEQLKEQAERARKAREAKEEARQQKSYEQLQALQKRWEEADKVVQKKRAAGYAKAKDIVNDWKERRGQVLDRCAATDAAQEKKMYDSWKQKEKKYEEWREQVKEEKARKSEEMAKTRAAASSRFAGELADRDARLEEAQRQAEQRRLAMEAEKRRELAERAERAEQRLKESWEARCRAANALQDRIKEVDAEVKRKEQQAIACLEKRDNKIHKWRQENAVWRVPGH
jgi:hypothetical protein